MYSLHSYGRMILDTLRMDAYAAALERTVKPGSIVLDIGTGPGIHALIAAQLGAARVYAVEPSDVVTLGPRLARANGFGDVIRFVRGLSTDMELDEQVDVVVSDLHGTLPWFGQAIPTLVDARSRLLKPGGVLLPQCDRVYMVPVEAPSLHALHAEPWNETLRGLVLDAALLHAVNMYSRGRVDRDGLLAEPELIAELDYRTVSDPNVAVERTFAAAREGTVHGLLVWFDTRICEEVDLSSAPWKEEISYGSAFFPLEQPVDIESGDRIDVSWRGTLNGASYVWAWDTRVAGSSGEIRASFRQNSFLSQLLSLEQLQKRAPHHRPRLGAEGEADRDALGWMDGSRSLEEIAELLRAEHPESVASFDAALERVRELSEEYG